MPFQVRHDSRVRVHFDIVVALTRPAYALWLVPIGLVQDNLANEIQRLAAFEPRSTPFIPHVTLYHPIALNSPVETIIDTISACLTGMPDELRLRLRPAQTGNSFYQSVLAAVDTHDALLSLQSRCEAAFGSLGKEYFPHLSLKYGDIDPDRRTAIAAQSMSAAQEVTVRGVTLMRLDGTVGEWQEVAFVPFS